MRLDDLYLVDIIEAGERTAAVLKEKDRHLFEQDLVLNSAVQHLLTVIGEACTRLGDQAQKEMPEIPFDKIRAFRNRLVHGYFDVDLSIVWEVASTHVPELAAAAENALQKLHPDTHLRLLERRSSETGQRPTPG